MYLSRGSEEILQKDARELGSVRDIKPVLPGYEMLSTPLRNLVKNVQVNWSGKREAQSCPCSSFNNTHKDVGGVEVQLHATLTSVLEEE